MGRLRFRFQSHIRMAAIQITISEMAAVARPAFASGH
jgi:hypothetical protein